MTVREEAIALVARALALGKKGRVIPADEMQEVIDELGGTYPTWLADLLTTVPLCGLELGWQASEADDNVSWLEWSDGPGILSESQESYPGLAILPAGFVNIGSCAMGTGDPYFISVNEGDDPPVYQVYHDVSDQADVILAEGRVTVAGCLSEFLATARIG